MSGLFFFIMICAILLALFLPIGGDWGGFKKRYKNKTSGV